MYALLDHMVARRGAVEAFERADALFSARVLAQGPSVVVSLDDRHDLAGRDGQLIRERRDVNDAYGSGLADSGGRAERLGDRTEPNRFGRSHGALGLERRHRVHHRVIVRRRRRRELIPGRVGRHRALWGPHRCPWARCVVDSQVSLGLLWQGRREVIPDRVFVVDVREHACAPCVALALTTADEGLADRKDQEGEAGEDTAGDDTTRGSSTESPTVACRRARCGRTGRTGGRERRSESLHTAGARGRERRAR